MKKKLSALLLALCMLLSACAVCAEDAYVPGQLTGELFDSAWSAGQVIGCDVSFSLDADPALLLETYAPDVDPASVNIPAILNCLKACVLSAGAAKTQDGVRIELSAQYAPQGASAAVITAAAELTPDGLSLESDLIEGQKVTAKWETLLALAGADQATTAAVMSFLAMGPEQLLAQIEAMLPMIEQAAGQLAAPYGQTIAEHIAALQSEQFTDIPADEDYPAAATLTRIAFTLSDVGALISALADQLEEDAVIAPALDTVLAQSSSGYTTAGLCDLVRSMTAMLSDDLPLAVDIGADENGTPLYVELYDLATMGANLYACVFVHPSADYPGSIEYWIELTTCADGENVDNSFYAGGLATSDPEDPYTEDFSLLLGLISGGTELGSLEMGTATYRTETDENLPCVVSVSESTITVSANPEANEYEYGETVWGTSADGSEWMYSVTTTSPSADSETAYSSIRQDFIVMPYEGSLAGAYTLGIQNSAEGIEDLTLGVQLYSEDYVSEQKSEVALETVTTDQMTALQNTLVSSLQAKYTHLISILPSNVAAMLTGE